MRDDPLLTIRVSPQLGTAQEEKAPVDIPLSLLALSVGLLENWLELTILPILIHNAEPPIAGLLIVGSIDPPVIDAGKVLGKVQEHIITGHGSTGEEVLRKPSLLEVVGVVLVGKDMNKQLTGWLEEPVNFLQQGAVVLHMLKHLNRNDTIVVLDDIEGTLVIGNVTSDDVDVVDVVTALLCSSEDVLPLRVAVGNAGNLAVGETLRQMQGHGPPSAAKVDDLHAILDLSPLAVEVQHGNLGLFERGGLGRPETRGVLLSRAQAHVVEGGGNLVVLLVRLVGGNGNGGGGLELVDDGHLALHVGLGGFRSEDGQMVRKAEADAETNERVGNDTSVNKRNEKIRRLRQDVEDLIRQLPDQGSGTQDSVRGVETEHVMRRDGIVGLGEWPEQATQDSFGGIDAEEGHGEGRLPAKPTG